MISIKTLDGTYDSSELASVDAEYTQVTLTSEGRHGPNRLGLQVPSSPAGRRHGRGFAANAVRMLHFNRESP